MAYILGVGDNAVFLSRKFYIPKFIFFSLILIF